MEDQQSNYDYQEFIDYIYLKSAEKPEVDIVSSVNVTFLGEEKQCIGSIKIGFLKDFDNDQKQVIVQEISEIKFPSHIFTIMQEAK